LRSTAGPRRRWDSRRRSARRWQALRRFVLTAPAVLRGSDLSTATGTSWIGRALWREERACQPWFGDGRSRALPQTRSMGGACQGCFNVNTQAIYALPSVGPQCNALEREPEGNRSRAGCSPSRHTKSRSRAAQEADRRPQLRTQSVTAMTGRSRKDRAGHAVDLACSSLLTSKFSLLTSGRWLVQQPARAGTPSPRCGMTPRRRPGARVPAKFATHQPCDFGCHGFRRTCVEEQRSRAACQHVFDGACHFVTSSPDDFSAGVRQLRMEWCRQ
jgi:hypothetical protein